MSASSLMAIGTRAMFAAQAQLNSISHNIANASTPGYSRQQTIQGTAGGQFTGSGYFGRGVTVLTVTRAHNMFLTQQAESARSGAAADGVRRDMLQQLEKVFGTGEAGLGSAATQLFNAFADLAAAPADLSARQAVLARAEDLASLARSNSEQLDAVQANARSDVQNSVSEVNTLADQVAVLNGRISLAAGSGQEANDLLDSRDHLVSQISEKVAVHTLVTADGAMSVFIAGGQSLVLGNRANHLVARRDDFDQSRTSLAIDVAGQVTPLDANFVGGALAGLLQFQNSDLTDARNRLGQLVTGLAMTMNQQQSFGLDLSGVAGAAMFSVGAPQALPALTNASLASVPLAAVTLAITDAKALKASEYLMDSDPANPGQFRVVRQSDGMVFSGVSSGDVIDGFSISTGTPVPAALDRFLLKPVGGAAKDMASILGNPRGLAAAAPVTAVSLATNTGTASIASLSIVAANTSPYAALSLRFSNASGAYDLLDSSNAVLASGTWAPGTPISYNGVALKIEGKPASGDQFKLVPTTFPAASNGNALAFDGLAERAFIDGQTPTDAYAQLLSDVGVRVQGAVAAADTSSTVSARASEALTSEVGVNLDEEAAKLIQFQQAYQAAAKMLQTAQTVMDTILQIGR